VIAVLTGPEGKPTRDRGLDWDGEKRRK